MVESRDGYPVRYQDGKVTISFNLKDISDDCIVCGDRCDKLTEDRMKRYKAVGNWCTACVTKCTRKILNKTLNGIKKTDSIPSMARKPLSPKQIVQYERIRGVGQ